MSDIEIFRRVIVLLVICIGGFSVLAEGVIAMHAIQRGNYILAAVAVFFALALVNLAFVLGRYVWMDEV